MPTNSFGVPSLLTPGEKHPAQHPPLTLKHGVQDVH